VVLPRQWQIRESIYEAQSELGVQAGLSCTDVRDLDQTEVLAKRFHERWLWDTAWEARLKNDTCKEAAKRSEIATNLKKLKDEKLSLRRAKAYINGGQTSRATNAPQGSHGRSAFTRRPTVPATSMRHRAPPSVPQSSYASASSCSPSTTNLSAQAQTKLENLQAQLDSIFADPRFSPAKKMALIGAEYESFIETQVAESAATSRYQNWGQGVSTMPSMTA